MIINYDRSAGFICPFCSSIVKRKINAFSFSGKNEITLTCPTRGCREECVTITKRPSKFRISVECPICGDDHSVMYQSEAFWSKELITYKCPSSGESIFHCGTDKSVRNALQKTIAEYSAPYDASRSDADMIAQMLDIVHEIKDEDKISCQCGSHNILIRLSDNNILLTCGRCKRVRVIEPTDQNLIMLINAESIVIGN